MFTNEELTAQKERLHNFARRLTGNFSDADDLLQATYLRALEKKHLYKDQKGSTLYSWLSKMMFNLFASRYRRKVKFETQYDPENFIEKKSVEPSQEQKVELKQMQKEINKLSDDHKKVIIFTCVYGMQYSEVSDKLDIPVGTVRSRLSRARQKLSDAVYYSIQNETNAQRIAA